MTQIVSIEKARRTLLGLSRKPGELGESLIIVRNSGPVSALIPFDEYESLLETLDILETEPDILKKLKKAEREIDAGHFEVWRPHPHTKTKRPGGRIGKRKSA
jgi:PHD/YefM family antitoxin component YafN of YafNO toxin-antitoxin module